MKNKIELLNKPIKIVTKRPNGRPRIQTSYENCPTLTEQHTAQSTDLNYLMKRYKPDELAAYIAARNQNREELTGHDFSVEPDMADAKNTVYQMKKAYDALSEEIRREFPTHLEFLKFIDNPQNEEKMIKLGLLKKKDIPKLTGQETQDAPTPPQAPEKPTVAPAVPEVPKA